MLGSVASIVHSQTLWIMGSCNFSEVCKLNRFQALELSNKNVVGVEFCCFRGRLELLPARAVFLVSDVNVQRLFYTWDTFTAAGRSASTSRLCYQRRTHVSALHPCDVGGVAPQRLSVSLQNMSRPQMTHFAFYPKAAPVTSNDVIKPDRDHRVGATGHWVWRWSAEPEVKHADKSQDQY